MPVSRGGGRVAEAPTSNIFQSLRLIPKLLQVSALWLADTALETKGTRDRHLLRMAQLLPREP